MRSPTFRGEIAHRVVALAHELDVAAPTEPHADALAHVTRVTTRAKRESSEIAPAELRGGSNFAGMAFPFIHDKQKGRNNAEFIAVDFIITPAGVEFI